MEVYTSEAIRIRHVYLNPLGTGPHQGPGSGPAVESDSSCFGFSWLGMEAQTSEHGLLDSFVANRRIVSWFQGSSATIQTWEGSGDRSLLQLTLKDLSKRV